jgi:hypothetical protein
MAAVVCRRDCCDCLLLVGNNPAVSKMIGWVIPDGWRRALAAQSARAAIVVVDPRRTDRPSGRRCTPRRCRARTGAARQISDHLRQ